LSAVGNQVVALGGHIQQISRHSTYEIIIPRRLIDREKRWTHFNEEHLDDQLSYLIQTGNGTHILKLKKNKNLLGEKFTIYTYNQEGKLESTPVETQTHCYYHGNVEGVPDSLLALSTCDGLRGILYIGDKQYGMEPVKGSNKFEHFLYVLDKSHEPFSCGVQNDDQYHEPILKYSNISHYPFSKDTHRRKRRNVLPEKRYVELYMVVDKNRYLIKRTIEAVQKETVELINYVDGPSQSKSTKISDRALKLDGTLSMISGDQVPLPYIDIDLLGPDSRAEAYTFQMLLSEALGGSSEEEEEDAAVTRAMEAAIAAVMEKRA
ncbi:PREDICTED: disintegrin and metalloproteinase domain-containing protein 9-like, partial [Thamnophis sirtalis]|uniref:Disintegrin and metalloproteinase domain-containing protein 9-like n=1 Tax=Thamnophis sirtalis TaxID=35019 RepID=A0A6I9XMY0_9SAUR